MIASPINGTKCYFGQRVIVDNDEIAVIVHAPKGSRDTGEEIWVKFQDGLVQWRAPHNVKPLPNGEL